MSAKMVPQLLLAGNGQIQSYAHDKGELDEFVLLTDKLITTNRLAETYIEVIEEAHVPCLQMYRSNAVKVSATSVERGKELLKLVELHWTVIRNQLQTNPVTSRVYENPNLLINNSFLPDEELRAVAKIAFETVALLYGCEFVLQPHWDSIRNYILGQASHYESPVEPSEDYPFVERFPDSVQLSFTMEHGVLFMRQPTKALAFVELYGLHRYKVSFPPFPGDIVCEMRAYEFSSTRLGHHELTRVELARRLQEFAPELLSERAKKNLDQMDVNESSG